ncbi:uncharacterized protein V6R79_017139 [Siganus canaliculatus]
MSAAEDDTELRDLLIQNLENNGVLNKLKAEMRAAVFLAMEEQDRMENKSPLVNENLNKCLSTGDGRLVASLVLDFLQVFNLDFTLAVFQPEVNALSGLDSRDQVCRELGLSQCDINRNSPVLLELVRRGRHTPAQGTQDSDVGQHPGGRETGPPVSKIPRYKGQRGQRQTAAQDPDPVPAPGGGDLQQPGSTRTSSSTLNKDRLDLDLGEDLDEGDSFFDDPLPKPQKTYGWKGEASRSRDSPAGSLSEALRPPGGGSSASEHSHSRTGASESRDRKGPREKTGSQHLDDDVEYDDDFNSHRSDLSRSELSIGEEIEEVSIEGPETSDKFDDTTQDLSISQLSHSHGADYMEDVA